MKGLILLILMSLLSQSFASEGESKGQEINKRLKKLEKKESLKLKQFERELDDEIESSDNTGELDEQDLKVMHRIPSLYKRAIRVDHTHELLGNTYSESVVRHMESEMAYTMAKGFVHTNLKKKYKKMSHTITKAIFNVSYYHGLDPFFVLALVQGESSFDVEAVGDVGEIGLMQIRPSTARWIAGKYKIKYKSKKDLFDPMINLRIGSAYLAYLRDHYNHASYYLSAYNMGQRGLERTIASEGMPTNYIMHIMRRYVRFYKAMAKRVGKDVQ